MVWVWVVPDPRLQPKATQPEGSIPIITLVLNFGGANIQFPIFCTNAMPASRKYQFCGLKIMMGMNLIFRTKNDSY